MTPKEKAIELVDKYTNECFGIGNYTAKKCALIAVNEIMEVCYYTREVENNDLFSYDYWIEVKQEIQKL